MSFTAKITAVFSLRRISGQIAALVLMSLVTIHGLITGYFLLSTPKPQLLVDQPMGQFELFARVIAQTPPSDRDLVLRHLDQTFPQLRLKLQDENDVSEASQRTPARTRIPLPDPLGGQVELIRGFATGSDRALLHLPDGKLLEADVGSPKMPPFVGGLWASTLMFLVVSITLFGVWTGRALSSPLLAFSQAAESFGLNHVSAPIPEAGPEEIRTAAKALNRMQERITGLMNDRTRMLAAISHDLRTPITRLRLRSEYIEDDSQREQTLRDLDQMQSMLDSVLTLLRGGSMHPPTLVDIAALLRMVCDEFSDCGHTVHYQGPARATLTIRPDEIKRAITNLVENAVRFATAVTVKLRTTNNDTIIEVADNGPGIPAERRQAMLEPFVRGDEARTMDATSGFGLGLSIAQALTQSHGGTLTLHDNDPHGLVVKLLLPRGPAGRA